MIVLDASAAVELLLGTTTGGAVWDRISRPGESLYCPHLLDVEVANALRRWVRRREVEPMRAEEALMGLGNLPLVRYPHDALLPRIWDLRDAASAYDAAYLALAEALDAPLVTCDRRLGGVVGHTATVEMI